MGCTVCALPVSRFQHQACVVCLKGAAVVHSVHGYFIFLACMLHCFLYAYTCCFTCHFVKAATAAHVSCCSGMCAVRHVQPSAALVLLSHTVAPTLLCGSCVYCLSAA
jgi:hypothetical protein